MNKQEALEVSLEECRKFEGMPEDDATLAAVLAVKAAARMLSNDRNRMTHGVKVAAKRASGALLFLMVDEEG
jgi:hypothetical protein